MHELSSTAPRLSRLKEVANLEPVWAKVLHTTVIHKLFRRAHPGVQIRLLTLLANKNDLRIKPVLADLRLLALQSRGVQEILRRIQKDGSFPVKGLTTASPRNNQLLLLAHVQKLRMLADFGGDRRWFEIKDALKYLLGFQNTDGRFPLPYHHQAAIGSLMLDLGLLSNPAVHKLAHWLAERQRPDGGWMHTQVKTGSNPNKSCIWTTAEVLHFLSRYPSMRIKEVFEGAGSFLLKNALKPNHTTLLPDAKSWDILTRGSRDVQLFQGGTLKVLAGLSQSGFHPGDTEFKKLYTWLLDQQLENGLFPAVVGQDQMGNEFVTARALGVIKRIETSRPEYTAKS